MTAFNVYLLIGDDDKPIYVGQSTNIKGRLSNHRNDRTCYERLGSQWGNKSRKAAGNGTA